MDHEDDSGEKNSKQLKCPATVGQGTNPLMMAYQHLSCVPDVHPATYLYGIPSSCKATREVGKQHPGVPRWLPVALS